MKKLMSKIVLLAFIFFCSIMTVVKPSFFPSFTRSSGSTASRLSFKYLPKVENQLSSYLKGYWFQIRAWLARPKRVDPKNVNFDLKAFKNKKNDNREEGNNTRETLSVD